MSQLSATLNKTLANTFVLYFKTHGFHWNVTGLTFGEMHGFFGEIYEDLHESVDVLAEQIRVLNEFAPTNLSTLYNNANLKESELYGNNVVMMLSELQSDFQRLIVDHIQLFNEATAANQQGLADYVAGRIDALNKWSWKIKSYLG
jgi:starvation-inducible DNA-binding protein